MLNINYIITRTIDYRANKDRLHFLHFLHLKRQAPGGQQEAPDDQQKAPDEN